MWQFKVSRDPKTLCSKKDTLIDVAQCNKRQLQGYILDFSCEKRDESKKKSFERKQKQLTGQDVRLLMRNRD